MHCDMCVYMFACVCVEGGGGGAGWMEVDSIANNICIKQNLSFSLLCCVSITEVLKLFKFSYLHVFIVITRWTCQSRSSNVHKA